MRAFDRLACSVSNALASTAATAVAIALIVAWAASGPLFDFSADWQLVVNTGTTVSTFVMGFVLLNAQRRDTLAVQAKLDELIRSSNASNELIGIEKAESAP